MSARRLALFAIAASLVTVSLAPAAAGDHCRSKITAHGRAGLAPTAAPPYAGATAGFCARLYERGVDDHVLPPGTDQVMVQLNGDFGPSVASVPVRLDGLGFENHTFRAYREPATLGGHYYAFPDWVPLPDGAQTGALRVTAYYPSATFTETYRVLAS